MDTMSAYARAQLAIARGDPSRVFDWDKAAEIIRDRKPEFARAGLSEDWEYTGGTIWRDGKIVIDDDMYLMSLWAIPELEINGEIIECWRYEQDAPGWDADTRWPASARLIVEADA